MPEYFNKDNFTPGEEDNSVRCTCGVDVDDNEPMVQCDGCAVWQHTSCMGEPAAKAAKEEGRQYHCQVCDPFVHRRLVQKLRKEHPLDAAKA
jgi:hypothetical protein